MPEPEGDTTDFVSGWMAASKTGGRLDPIVLELIDRHRSESSLDEDGLVEALAMLADEAEARDEPGAAG